MLNTVHDLAKNNSQTQKCPEFEKGWRKLQKEWGPTLLKTFFGFISDLKKKTVFIYLVLFYLHCCPGAYLVAASRNYPLVTVSGLPIAVASLLACTGSRVCGLQQL